MLEPLWQVGEQGHHRVAEGRPVAVRRCPLQGEQSAHRIALPGVPVLGCCGVRLRLQRGLEVARAVVAQSSYRRFGDAFVRSRAAEVVGHQHIEQLGKGMQGLRRGARRAQGLQLL